MYNWPSLALALSATFAIAVLLLLWWLVRRLQRENRSEPERPGLWDGREHACPHCGGAMEPGWVLLGKGAIWSDRGKGRPGTFAHIGRSLPNTLSLSLPPAANMAWRCHSCQMLLIDHSRLIGRR
jgi:hypothetical protein